MNFEELVGMGFTPSTVTRVLAQSGNNFETALDLLLAEGAGQEVAAQPFGGLGGAHSGTVFSSKPLHQVSQQQLSELDVTILPISQYSFPNGTSACTAVSLMTMAEFLWLLDGGECPMNFHDATKLSTYLIEGIQEYQKHREFVQSAGPEHLAVEEFFAATEPLWSKLRQKGEAIQKTLQDRLSFASVLQEAKDLSDEGDKYVGVTITKPPETIFVILPPRSTTDGTYFLFDSHSRPGVKNQSMYNSKFCIPRANIDCCLFRLWY